MAARLRGDCHPVDLVVGANDENHATVTNILRFLQTLDDDGNPNNGIQITENVRRASSGTAIDFNRSELEFEQDLTLQNRLSDLTLFTSAGQRSDRIRAGQEHFRLTLTQIYLSGNLPSGIGERLSEEELLARGFVHGEELW